MTLHANQGYTFETTGGTQATIGSTGATAFKNTTNSATAFQIQNAAATSILTVNTTSGNVTINASATTYTQRLCHNQANAATTNMTLGDCNSVGQADLAEFYDTDGSPE